MLATQDSVASRPGIGWSDHNARDGQFAYRLAAVAHDPSRPMTAVQSWLRGDGSATAIDESAETVKPRDPAASQGPAGKRPQPAAPVAMAAGTITECTRTAL